MRRTAAGGSVGGSGSPERRFMKKQPFGISIVSVVIIGIGSLLSSCDFRMSVKDRTGETQEYTAESAAAENTLPLEVVKYQQLDINQIGKVLYDM